MLRVLLLLACTASTNILATMLSPARGDDAPPAWAYPVNPPDFKPPPDDGKPRSVPGSDRTYTVPQTRDRFFAPVWYPAEHPPLPEVVRKGASPVSSPAASVTAPMAPAARRTQASRDCRRPISRSRWPTTKPASAPHRSPAATWP